LLSLSVDQLVDERKGLPDGRQRGRGVEVVLHRLPEARPNGLYRLAMEDLAPPRLRVVDSLPRSPQRLVDVGHAGLGGVEALRREVDRRAGVGGEEEVAD